jgi:type IV pilus assembly protein PilY1
VLNLETGKLVRVIKLDKGRSFSGRLFTEGVDIDGDGYDDYLFVGYSRVNKDRKWEGGIIAIRTKGDNPDDWEVDTYTYLKDEDDKTKINPITSKILVSQCFPEEFAQFYTGDKKVPKVFFLYFGTGKWLFKEDDKTEYEVNYLYGLPVKCFSEKDGVKCDIITDNTKDSPEGVCKEADKHSLAGWRKELEASNSSSSYYKEKVIYYKEKVISDPVDVTDKGVVLFVTIQPTKDVCGFGGHSRIWGLNCATGGSMFEGCPESQGGAFQPSEVAGTVLLQLSTGNIEQVTSSSFDEEGKTDWYEGIASSEAPPFISTPAGSVVGRLLLWLER